MIFLTVSVLLLFGVAGALLLTFLPERTRRDWSELKHQQETAVMRREERRGALKLLISMFTGIIAIIIGVTAWATWGVWGLLVASVVWVCAVTLSRYHHMRRFAQRIYERYERPLVKFTDTPYAGLLRRLSPHKPLTYTLESAGHLERLIAASPRAINDEQRDHVIRALKWPSIPLAEVMTDWKDVMTVKRTELLGPLVLDDLHKTGHEVFPVMSAGQVVGILDIRELLEVHGGKHSDKVNEVMMPGAVFGSPEQLLPDALHALTSNRQFMLIIRDDTQTPIGIVTLRRLIRLLHDGSGR